MAMVRSKNTKPELLIRSVLHRMGFRFRLHRKDLPGCPDICLPMHRKIVFVHGCFWHGHRCQHGSRRPATNVAYWNAKIEGNICKDAAAIKALRSLGWRSLIVWECQLKSPNINERLARFLRRD
jgi:DNA mismatch endonuclease (patch repair protein)